MGDNWTSRENYSEQRMASTRFDQRIIRRSPHHEVHNYDALAADLEKYIDHHNLENVVLLGHSMGKTVMNFTVETKIDKCHNCCRYCTKGIPIHHTHIEA